MSNNLLSSQICRQVCSVDWDGEDYVNCKGKLSRYCLSAQDCIIHQKSEQQKEYIVSQIERNTFLKACPGSGKTEVLGIKTAYELSDWKSENCGIAILTFTNSAENEMISRIAKYAGSSMSYPHFIGTFTSWLHGYISNPFLLKFMGAKGNKGDYSLRLVETNVVADFLHSFKTDYAYGKLGNIAANRYYFCMKEGKYISAGNDYERGLFDSFTEDWQIDDLNKTKSRFWQSGFFTYEDIEVETFRFLIKCKETTKYISDRFPIIIVDECQDLSLTQIGILNCLLKCGTKLHFIGDLNQSIYLFRNIFPEDTNKYIKKRNFDVYELKNNYRSCQKITDICKTIVLDQTTILGCEEERLEFSLIAFLYNKNMEQKMIADFLCVLEEKGLSPKESKVLVRNDSLRNNIYNSKPNPAPNILELYATALYSNDSKNSPVYFAEVIEAVGKATANVFFSDVHIGSKIKLYCPQTIETITWRKMLSVIINSLSSNPKLDYLTLTWNQWKKELSVALIAVSSQVPELKDRKVHLRNIRDKCGDKKVIDYLRNAKKDVKAGIEVSTIHGSKGLTLDAVLVVSSYNSTKDDEGNGAHWKEWFNKITISEKNRLAYVAFSRPKYLLALGIPNIKGFSDEDRKILIQHGFKIME